MTAPYTGAAVTLTSNEDGALLSPGRERAADSCPWGDVEGEEWDFTHLTEPCLIELAPTQNGGSGGFRLCALVTYSDIALPTPILTLNRTCHVFDWNMAVPPYHE